MSTADRKAFVAEALLLRELHSFREARQRAKDYGGVDVSNIPDPPPYEKLTERYDELMSEWVAERPDTYGDALAYLDLVSEIVGAEIMDRYRDEGGIVASERDLGYAMELLARVRSWVNDKDLACLMREKGIVPFKDGEASGDDNLAG